MKRLLIITLLISTLATAESNFNDGLQSYLKGDYKTALEVFEPLALQGDSNAQLRLASMYLMGHGVLQDYKESFKWLKESAANGNGTAEYNIGMAYIYKYGVNFDLNKAKYWIKRAYTNPNSTIDLKKTAKETWDSWGLGRL